MITGEGYTNRGGREYNEDAGMLIIHEGGCYAVIADGLGGHGGGGQASKTAVAKIKECIRNLPEEKKVTEDKSAEWFAQANQKVLAMQTDTLQMKTTLAFLHVPKGEDRAVLAHLGDSRIYHFEEKKCVFCTFDHSVSRMAVLAGEITLEELRFHADRNKLLKAVGKSENVKAETKEISLSVGNFHAFLLCTDGFWEYVTEEEMEASLAAADSAADWLAAMRRCHKAKCRATGKTDHDNHSAIVVWVTGRKR